MGAPAASQGPHVPSAIAAPIRGQVAGRIAAGVEVLMEPASGGTKMVLPQFDADVLSRVGVLDGSFPEQC